MGTKVLTNVIFKNYYIIFIVSFLLSAPLFVSGFIEAHDLPVHISRVVATVEGFKDGQLLPKIGPDLMNGFGYAWNIFYAPLSAYIPAFLSFFLPSYIGAVKLFIFLTLFLSGIFMHKFVFNISKSTRVSLISSILYVSAPYRLVDIYIRGAMGEVLTFVFLPIFFQGVYGLTRNKQHHTHYITIGFVGLLLSHNISALLAAIFGMIYLLFYFKKIKSFLSNGIVNVLFSLGIVSFFLFPLVEHKVKGNYEVFLPNRMGSLDMLHQHSVYIYQLLFGVFRHGGSYDLSTIQQEMPYTLGLFIVIPILLAPLVINRINLKNKYVVLFILGFISIVMMLPFFPWLKMPSFLAFIQFPWRLLMIAIFFLSIVSAVIIVKLLGKFNTKLIVILIMMTFVYIGPLINVAINNTSINDNDFEKVEKIDPNSAYSPGSATFEYLPTKAKNNLTYISQRTQDAIVLEGNASLQNQEKNGTNLEFQIDNVTTNVNVELPFIYYLGYSAKIESDKKTTEIPTYESENGFLAISLPEGIKGKIIVKFEGTIVSKISNGLSVISLILFILYVYRESIFISKKSKKSDLVPLKSRK